MRKNSSIAILGSGSWATALVKLISPNSESLSWWVRDEASIIHIQLHQHNPKYLTDAELDIEKVHIDNDILKISKNADILILAIPSAYLAEAIIPIRSIIKEKFIVKFKNLEVKFKKSEFLYLLVYRFVGGIPFALSNVLPCIFNVKTRNFFLATLIGITPQIFLVVSIGSGLEKIIEQNLEAPKLTELMLAPEIYQPFIAFFILIIATLILKKIFYR